MAKGESFKWFGGDGFVTNRIFPFVLVLTSMNVILIFIGGAQLLVLSIVFAFVPFAI